ncbi:hypothetical protein MXL81_07830 [Staphylococcus pseudoxylosus]|uniref:hypothetical protein n=1 Tax=Staphylococcus pseudoxylosus TaxID=2282419 RepID=UPI002DBA8AA2|nr:hypothetical protein [Staphylococcus pseudoxylosus]MEB6170583.1 hypothetical protein [Staphylococcus pseudoxylosus]
MARVAWILPSSEVFNNNEKQLVIDAPFAEINLINIPSQYSFTISFGIIGLDIKKYNVINFEIGSFKNDDKEILFEAPLHIGDPRSDEVKEIDEKGLAEFISNVSLKNFVFKQIGLHYVKMEIDGNAQLNYFNVNVSGEVNERR